VQIGTLRQKSRPIQIVQWTVNFAETKTPNDTGREHRMLRKNAIGLRYVQNAAPTITSIGTICGLTIMLDVCNLNHFKENTIMNYGKNTSGGSWEQIKAAQEARRKEAARLGSPVFTTNQQPRGGQACMTMPEISLSFSKEKLNECSNFIIIKKQGCELGGEHEGVRFDFPSKVTDMTS
jgi:hypothetical protein